MDTLFENPVAAGQYTIVNLQPGREYGWEVVLEGSAHSHFFADRSLALTYAKAWAAANRPSKVRVTSGGEGLEHEWTFR
jgi:hypothetical protein